MSLYNSFRNLVRILFGLLLHSRFKEEIVLKTSILSVEVFRNNSVFKGRKLKCFSWKSEYLCAICFEFRSSTKPWFNFFFSPVHFCCWPLLKRRFIVFWGVSLDVPFLKDASALFIFLWSCNTSHGLIIPCRTIYHN